MGLVKLRHLRHEPARRKHRRRGDMQGPRRIRPGERLDRSRNRAKPGAQRRGELPPLDGERHRPPAAVHQRHAHMGLERPQLLADRRVTDVERGASRDHRPGLRKGRKGTQRGQRRQGQPIYHVIKPYISDLLLISRIAMMGAYSNHGNHRQRIETMLGILAQSFRTAARTQPQSYNHWGRRTRFDDRREAELVAHTEGRRRD